MDNDSKVIFENYIKSQVINEGLQGLVDFFVGAGRKAPVTFSKATIKELETSLKLLESNILKVTYSSLGNPRAFSDLSLQLADGINGTIRTMANTIGANRPDFLGHLKTIAANYNQTIQEFLELSKSGLTPSDIKKTINSVNAGYDEVINLARSTNGTSLTRRFADDIVNNLTQLKANLKEAEKFANETALKDRGKALLLIDWMKANKLWATMSVLMLSVITFGAQDTGYGIAKIGIKIGQFLSSIFKDGIFGMWEGVKEEYPEVAKTQTSTSNWPQIISGGLSTTQTNIPSQTIKPQPSPTPRSRFKQGELDYGK